MVFAGVAGNWGGGGTGRRFTGGVFASSLLAGSGSAPEGAGRDTFPGSGSSGSATGLDSAEGPGVLGMGTIWLGMRDIFAMGRILTFIISISFLACGDRRGILGLIPHAIVRMIQLGYGFSGARASRRNDWARVVIGFGVNRVLRRIFSARGYSPSRARPIGIGPRFPVPSEDRVFIRWAVEPRPLTTRSLGAGGQDTPEINQAPHVQRCAILENIFLRRPLFSFHREASKERPHQCLSHGEEFHFPREQYGAREKKRDATHANDRDLRERL